MFHGRHKKASWTLMPTTLFLSAFLFFNEKETLNKLKDEAEKPVSSSTFSISNNLGQKVAENLGQLVNSVHSYSEDEWLKKNLDARQTIANTLTNRIKKNQKPDQLTFDPILDQKDKSDLKINYALQDDVQKEADSLLQRYKPDYAAIVMMDAKTGQILAMSSFEKNKSDSNENLALKAGFPAASIFKIITAAAAVDKAGIGPEHKIAFNGGNYTLYKKNVLSDKVTKWTRFITLKEAFARSINTAFGRLSLEALEPKDLSEYANRFMFNQSIPTDISLEQSHAAVPNEKGFALTEVASGYNRFNTLSPIHGAMIAATIVNDGKMMIPYLIDSLVTGKNEQVYKAQPLERGQIIRPESADKVRQMMEQTILAGTSRKTFRNIVRDKKFREIEMGGKTGHFSGLNPKGRTDWFVGYASDEDDKIAIAAITVNVQKWTVKSSALGEMMFRKYFKNKLEEKEALLDLPTQNASPLHHRKNIIRKKRNG